MIQSMMSIDKDKLLLLSGNQFGMYNMTLNIMEIPFAHRQEINSYRTMAYNPKRHLLALSTDDKTILTSKTAKKANVMFFHPNGTQLMVADKFGDVFGYIVPEIGNCVLAQELSDTPAPVLWLGHVSMITDMKLSTDKSFILSCDRDEKIRVSHFPNCYDIETFCLGHTQYVSRMALVGDEFLVSGGGDGCLIVWKYRTGTLLSKIDLVPLLSGQSSESLVVSGLIVSPDGKTLVVYFDRLQDILLFDVNVKKGFICFSKKVTLPAIPLCILFDHSNRKWVSYYQHSTLLTCLDDEIDLPELDAPCQSSTEYFETSTYRKLLNSEYSHEDDHPPIKRKNQETLSPNKKHH